MTQDYIIINKAFIQKRIEELEWSLVNIPEIYIPKHEAQIYALKEILSQSTPLIHEIKKVFKAAKIPYKVNDDGIFGYENAEHYIENLKLDI